jgi:hypothetical protein
MKMTQLRAEKGKKLSDLLTSASQFAGKGDLEKAIALYREMENASDSMPNWSFYAKNGLSSTLARAGRTEEARLKLGEAEKIAKDHPDILNGANQKTVIDYTLQQIESSELAKKKVSSNAKPKNGISTLNPNQPITTFEPSGNNSSSESADNSFEPPIYWNYPQSITVGSVFKLDLVFKNCDPPTFVKLPENGEIQFLGQPGRSQTYALENFKQISTTTLSYSATVKDHDGKGVEIPVFEIETNKGKFLVPSIEIDVVTPAQSQSAVVLPQATNSQSNVTSDTPTGLPTDYSSLKENLKREGENVIPPDYSRSGQETDWDRECQGGWWPSGTEVGRYKLAFYQKVGRIWDDVAMIYGPRLQAGRIVINFRIQPDGSVADLRVTQGDATSTLAQVVRPILAKAVGQSGSFSRALKKESPDGFEWQLAFRVDN